MTVGNLKYDMIPSKPGSGVPSLMAADKPCPLLQPSLPWCAGGGAEPKLEFMANEVQTDRFGGGQGGGGLGDIEKLEPLFLTLGT